MILLQNEPVAIKKKAVDFGPFSLDAQLPRLSISLARVLPGNPTLWIDPTQELSCECYLSFDGGPNRLFLGSFTAAGAVPTGGRRGGAVAGVSFFPLPTVCAICGNLYHPGDRRYERSLLHSDIALKDKQQSFANVRAEIQKGDRGPVASQAARVDDFKLHIVPDDEKYFERTFHTPTPAPVDLRLFLTISSPNGSTVDTALTVEQS